MKNKTIWRMPDVMDHTGLSRSTITGLVATGRFPKPIKLSARCIGWVSYEVIDWIDERIRASREGDK